MIIVCIILSSLALLAAVSNIILFFVEKKRNTARRQAMLDYISNTCDSTREAAEKYIEDYFKEAANQFNIENKAFYESYSISINDRFDRLQSEIDSLKNGACPDYEKALAAANAVNDFNTGIAGILNFDPIAAARKTRLGENREVE